MAEITFTSAAEVTVADLARADTAIWSAVPYSEPHPDPPQTPESYGEFCRVQNIDLARSVVARDAGGQIVGIAMFARRGDDGYCEDFGVVAEFRRRGIGRGLIAAFIEQARQAGVRTLRLDTGAENEPAQRIYEAAGFRRIRDIVYLWASVAQVGRPVGSGATVRSASLRELPGWFRRGDTPRPFWEDDLPALLALANTRALVAEGGGREQAYLLYRSAVDLHGHAHWPTEREGHVHVDYIGLVPGAQPDDVRALLLAAAADAPATATLRKGGEPEGSRLHGLLASIGFGEVARAYEMECDLGAS